MPSKHSKKARNNSVQAPTYYRRVAAISPSYLIGLYRAAEASGLTYTNYSSKTGVNLELCENTGFETAGGGGADVFAGWTESAGDGAIADETSLVHGGSHAAKLTAGASANTTIRPSDSATSSSYVIVRPGTTISYSFWTRGDGTNAGRYSIYDNTNGAFIKSTATTGVTGTTYTQVTYSFTVPAGCHSINFNLVCPTTNGGIAYFDDVTITATTFTLHGLYTASGVTYGGAGPITLMNSVVLDGNNTGITMGSKGLNSVFNPNLMSMVSWGKVDGSSRWTDSATYRYIGIHFKADVDTTKYITFGKTTTNHQLVWRRRCAGSVYDKTYTFSPAGPTGWFCMGVTVDVVSSPNRIATYLYVPGVLDFTINTDEEPATGNEEWTIADDPITGTNTVAFAGTVSAQEWIGSAGLTAVWSGIALTDDQMRRAMVP